VDWTVKKGVNYKREKYVNSDYDLGACPNDLEIKDSKKNLREERQLLPFWQFSHVRYTLGPKNKRDSTRE